jgi:hypothetical protein
MPSVYSSVRLDAVTVRRANISPRALGARPVCVGVHYFGKHLPRAPVYLFAGSSRGACRPGRGGRVCSPSAWLRRSFSL